LDIIFSRDKFDARREPFTPRVTLASPCHLLTDAFARTGRKIEMRIRIADRFGSIAAIAPLLR
jgi:hypothetical protein